MWKSIVVDQKSLFIKYEREEDLHKVYLSDTVNLWMEGLTSSNLSKRCKEMNSLVEAEPEDLARHVCTLISDNREDTCITGSEEGEMRMIHIESKLAGIPFYFTFRMEKMNRDEFCKQLTTPLMLLVVQQQTRLAQLQTMLIAKDSEIEQYKLEGAILKKRKMETQPFLLSELAQNEPEKFNSIDPPNSIDLFKKMFHLLPSISASNEKILKRHSLNDKRTMDLIQSEPEEKCETRHLIASTEVTSAKEEKSSTEAQNVSVTQVGKSKKIKLRI
ncbi:hypothetical protein R5R35_008654 [Gryllus longicercus]|uniref:Non-homologous end-joining factor 1 n=1 Tax=Gryllus longicercus TaxID=2509291 RepID=A0AAN9VLG8_9ORTH